jgi:hypothetical protein
MVMLVLGLLISFAGFSQGVRQVLSYVNISRPNGGAVSSGDILEIRAVITVLNGTTIYKVKFTGIAPINTTYVPGTLAAKANSGATTGNPNVGTYTDAINDDRGEVRSGVITINLGETAGLPPADGGTIIGGSTDPRHGSSATIIQATYRVTVNATNGSQLVTQGNSFSYSTTAAGFPAQQYIPDLGILITPQYSCSAMDPRNRIDDETEGSFSRGTTLNRAASPIVTGFNYVTIASGRPQDGSYAVVKSTSPTEYVGASPANSDRVYNSWQIFGDHTGTNNGAGNPAPGNGVEGGYMLLVNASYSPGSVFTTNVTGLPQNFDFTVSFWIRNITTTTTVLPNLILSVNGYDVYGTGNIGYTNQWVQKTFTFNTGSSTSVAINLRNNAPGGSGNDWAIDDFMLNQCLIVLPVSLVNFNATYQSGQTQLNWETGNDDQISRYTVEYSNDGKSFYTAGDVMAQGNGGKYQFVDTRAVDGKMYYRIKIVDKQERQTYSKVLIVRNQSTQEMTMKVSPNPMTANPTISLWSDSRQNVNVKMLDASGRMVVQTQKQMNKGANSFVLNTSGNMKPGIYFVQMHFDNGKVMTEKVMVAQ